MRMTRFARLGILVAMLFLLAPARADADDPPFRFPDPGEGVPPPNPHEPSGPPPPDAEPSGPPPPDAEPVPVAAPADRVVYSNDFEGAVGREWSLPITDITPDGNRRFLGQFGNDSVVLALRNLPAHQTVLVTFDLFVIRTWDGNRGDVWGLALADGRTIFQTTFSNMHEFRQACPGPGRSRSKVGSPSRHPPRVGRCPQSILPEISGFMLGG